MMETMVGSMGKPPWGSLPCSASSWISSQHHVDQNYDHGTVNSDDDTDGYEIKDILMLNL